MLVIEVSHTGISQTRVGYRGIPHWISQTHGHTGSDKHMLHIKNSLKLMVMVMEVLVMEILVDGSTGDGHTYTIQNSLKLIPHRIR